MWWKYLARVQMCLSVLCFVWQNHQVKHFFGVICKFIDCTNRWVTFLINVLQQNRRLFKMTFLWIMTYSSYQRDTNKFKEDKRSVSLYRKKKSRIQGTVYLTQTQTASSKMNKLVIPWDSQDIDMLTVAMVTSLHRQSSPFELVVYMLGMLTDFYLVRYLIAKRWQ